MPFNVVPFQLRGYLIRRTRLQEASFPPDARVGARRTPGFEHESAGSNHLHGLAF